MHAHVIRKGKEICGPARGESLLPPIQDLEFRTPPLGPATLAFNSYLFWLFFPVVIGLSRLLPHRGQNRMLLAASHIFYGTRDARFLLLVAISILVDFLVAHLEPHPGQTLVRSFHHGLHHGQSWNPRSLQGLRLLAGMTGADFSDGYHLGERGTKRFTRFLAEALAEERSAGTTLSP